MSEGVSKRAVIKELLELAKKNGKISLGELNDRLSEVDLSVEEIEKIYEKLDDSFDLDILLLLIDQHQVTYYLKLELYHEHLP